MRRRERLADEVDRRDADELDVGMEEKAPDELAAAVTAAADDGGLEALGHGARRLALVRPGVILGLPLAVPGRETRRRSLARSLCAQLDDVEASVPQAASASSAERRSVVAGRFGAIVPMIQSKSGTVTLKL